MPYLYLIKCRDIYKIGIAADVKARLASLQTGNPYPIEVCAYYQFQDPSPVEKSLHQKFYDKRKQGEWFALGGADLKALDDICALLGGVKQSMPIVLSASDLQVIENQEDNAIAEQGACQGIELGIVNSGIFQIERHIGPVIGEMQELEPNGETRAILLLPVGLAWCQNCRRVRFPSQMLPGGRCQHCQH